jgi:hypothetical protein
MLCDSTSSNWNYYNISSYNWWINSLIYWNYPLLIVPLISTDSNYQTIGFFITIGGLTLVVIGIEIFNCFMGSFKGKKIDKNNYTNNQFYFNNNCYYFSCK